MLDEESRFPKGTDQTYLEKLVAAHGKHKNFSKSKQAGSTFGVIHYAGEVQYLITNFLDKNKDEVSELAFEALKKTKVDLLKTLADQKADAGDGDGRTVKKKSTVASTFRTQLLTLVSVLGSTAPQYVRCIKPNSQKSAFLWDDELVLAQLRYSGMLETIRIRKAGYAWRVPFVTFYKKYRWLASKIGANADPRDQCKQILDQLKMSSDHWQLGKTKVFMRNSVFIPLQDALDRHIKKCATIVAKVIKGNYYRQHYKRIRANVQILQKSIRMYTKRRIYLRRQKAAVRIQSVIRGWFARDYYKQLKREKAEREERLRKEAEAKAKREAEEAEKRRIEEEARRSREAADAERKRQADEKKRVEEEKKKADEDAKKEAARLKKEEEEILKLTKAAMAAKDGSGTGSESLGDMFSFINNVVDKDLAGSDKVDHGQLDGLDEELEEIFENGAKVLRKRKSQGVLGSAPAAPAPPSDADIYEKLKKRGEGKTDASRAMKSNPLSRKGDDKDEHSENETMAAFASKYFEEHDKLMGGTIANTLSRKKKKVTMEEMLCYTRQPIPLSMLKVTVPADDARHDKMVTVAIEIFREGLRIGDPNLKNADPTIPPMIQNVVKLGIGVPELRDEILVQLVRQCTENPADLKNWDIISIRYWQLLAVCLSCFPPSKTLAKPLRNFLRTNAEFDEAEEEKRTVPDPGKGGAGRGGVGGRAGVGWGCGVGGGGWGAGPGTGWAVLASALDSMLICFGPPFCLALEQSGTPSAASRTRRRSPSSHSSARRRSSSRSSTALARPRRRSWRSMRSRSVPASAPPSVPALFLSDDSPHPRAPLARAVHTVGPPDHLPLLLPGRQRQGHRHQLVHDGAAGDQGPRQAHRPAGPDRLVHLRGLPRPRFVPGACRASASHRSYAGVLTCPTRPTRPDTNRARGEDDREHCRHPEQVGVRVVQLALRDQVPDCPQERRADPGRYVPSPPSHPPRAPIAD